MVFSCGMAWLYKKKRAFGCAPALCVCCFGFLGIPIGFCLVQRRPCLFNILFADNGFRGLSLGEAFWRVFQAANKTAQILFFIFAS